MSGAATTEAHITAEDGLRRRAAEAQSRTHLRHLEGGRYDWSPALRGAAPKLPERSMIASCATLRRVVSPANRQGICEHDAIEVKEGAKRDSAGRHLSDGAGPFAAGIPGIGVTAAPAACRPVRGGDFGVTELHGANSPWSPCRDAKKPLARDGNVACRYRT